MSWEDDNLTPIITSIKKGMQKMENVENLILEHLKALRSGQDNIIFEVKEVKSRLTSLESMTASGRRDGALLQEEIYR